MGDKHRGTGRTTKQITDAPIGATFIWCNGHIDYPKRLAAKLGRGDLKIMPFSYLQPYRIKGRYRDDVVIDHAAEITLEQHEMLLTLHHRPQVQQP